MTKSENEIYDLCVVGSGIAGLGAIDAYLTAKPGASILVLEADDWFGGHEKTVEIWNKGAEKTLVDCGFMVYNHRTYPNMLRLFDKFGIEGKPSDMSLSTYYGETIEGTMDTTDSWSFGGGFIWVLANVWRPRLWRFLSSHTKFRKVAVRVLAGKAREVGSLGEFCKVLLKEEEFQECWLKPFIKAVWSLPSDADADEYPLLPLLQFMENHGFLSDPLTLPSWYTPKHRAQSITAAVLGDAIEPTTSHADKRITCKSNHRVVSVSQPKDGLMTIEVLRTSRGTGSDGNSSFGKTAFSARKVLLAGSGVSQAEIIRSAYPDRHAILDGKINVSYTRGILHSDERYMPARKSDWTAWNVGKCYSTYWINKLQGQSGGHLFFTLPMTGFRERKTGELIEDFQSNTILDQFEGGVFHVWDTTHPVHDLNTTDVVTQLMRTARGSSLQHCGAWMRHGFHEDGIVTGRLAARELLGEDGVGLPVYFPMSSNPNLYAEKIKIPLLHTVIAGDKKTPFASTWEGYLFNSLCPPVGVLACDHNCGHVSGETTLLQDGAIRELFLQHTGIFPVGPILVWTMPRSVKTWAAFNPFSLYVAFDDANQFATPMDVLNGNKDSLAFLTEVHNTPWGESVFYGWRHENQTFPFEVTRAKTMHVSPMNQVPAEANLKSEYRFTVKSPSAISITLIEDETEVFRADFNGDRMELCEGEKEKEWSAYGSIKAFAEVYARAASKIFKGQRLFNPYEAISLTEEEKLETEDENKLVWFTGFTYWMVAIIYFACLYYLVHGARGAASSPSPSDSSLWWQKTAFGIGIFSGFVSMMLSHRYQMSSETDLGSGVLSQVTWMISRFALFVFVTMFDGNEQNFLGVSYEYSVLTVAAIWCLIFLFHNVIVTLLPIARSTRVSLQSLEPVILHVTGDILEFFRKYITLYYGSEIDLVKSGYSVVESVEGFASRFYNRSPTAAEEDTFSDTLRLGLVCLMIWTIGRVLITVVYQLFWDSRMHHRQLGLRPAVHVPAEKFGIFATAVTNAVCMAIFCLFYFSRSFATDESVIGPCPHTILQCTLFAAYCSADLLCCFIFWYLFRNRRSVGKKESGSKKSDSDNTVADSPTSGNNNEGTAETLTKFETTGDTNSSMRKRNKKQAAKSDSTSASSGTDDAESTSAAKKGPSIRSGESGKKGMTVETNADAKTPCKSDASANLEKTDGKARGKTYVSQLYADFGFNAGVLVHHLSSMTVAWLGVTYYLWRNEFVWMGGFEASTPFLYLWIALRPERQPSEEGKGENRSPVMAKISPMFISLMRFCSYLLFTSVFFVFRIVIGLIGMYYLIWYRLPYTYSVDSRPFSFGPENLGLKMGFWVTFWFGMMPLMAMQFIWFYKMSKLAKFEAVPLLEATLNSMVGNDWFEVVCDKSAGKQKKQKRSDAADVRVDEISNSRPKQASYHNYHHVASSVSNGDGNSVGISNGKKSGVRSALNVQPKYRMTLHRPWNFVHAFATRGDVGVGESFVNGDFTCEVIGVKVAYEHALHVTLAHLSKLSYSNSNMYHEEASGERGLFGTIWSILSDLFTALLGGNSVGDLIARVFPDHASNVGVPDMTKSQEDRQESISIHYDGDQALFDSFQGETRVYTAALFSAEELVAAGNDDLLRKGMKNVDSTGRFTLCPAPDSRTTSTASRRPSSQLTFGDVTPRTDVSPKDPHSSNSTTAREFISVTQNLIKGQVVDRLSDITHTSPEDIERHNGLISDILNNAQRRKIARILGDLGGLERRGQLRPVSANDKFGLESPANSTSTHFTAAMLTPTTSSERSTNNKRGARILDLGCGYGELVLQACRDYEVEFGMGITNSKEMGGEFKRRIETEYAGFAHLQKSAHVQQGDFLDLAPCLAALKAALGKNDPAVGKDKCALDKNSDHSKKSREEELKFDLITSVESIEAIYMCQYRKLASECRKVLKDGGQAVFQIIHAYGSRNPTIRRKKFQPGTTFVQVYIFPGQQLPYLEYVLDEFRAEGMICTHIEQAGLHYAKTLRVWREKLWHATYQSTTAPTWSEEEYRKFVYYLAWCEAGFGEGLLDVARCVFVKA